MAIFSRPCLQSLLLGQLRYKKPTKPWQNFEAGKKFRRNLWLMNGGILLTVFAACYLVVPLYRSFCQAAGLIGDDMQKDYSSLAKDGQKRSLPWAANIHRKYKVVFRGETDPELPWVFEPEQDVVTVHAGEPALMFYRTFNKSDKPLVGSLAWAGIALYSVFPEDAGYYFSKIQCFCFNQQVLNGKEELQMPLYFYLEPEIDNDKLLHKNTEIKIYYKFYLARNQDLANWMLQQQKWEYEQKSFLRKKRIEKLRTEGLSTSELENEEELEKHSILSQDPDYRFGARSPNQLTEFKQAN